MSGRPGASFTPMRGYDDEIDGRPGVAAGRRGSVTAEESTLADRISHLMESTETLTKRIELERRKGQELDKKIKISRSKLEESRGKLRGIHTEMTEGGRVKERSLKAAEHRLEVVTSRLNQTNKSNDALKQVIEALRRDKLQRQRILKRLEREVETAKTRADTTNADASAASDARDRAEREIAALQATLQREGEAYEAEFEARISSFTHQIEARKRAAAAEQAIFDSIADARSALPSVAGAGALSNVLGGGGSVVGGDGGMTSRSGAGGAGTDRGHAKAAAAAAAAAAVQEAAEETQGSMTVEQEVELKHRSVKTLWEIARREVEVREQRAKLAALEDSFARIQESTGIQSIDDMVASFVAAEDRNYALLTMINDLNREIEAAEVENASLRAAVEEARSRGSAGQASRETMYRDWDAQLRGLTAKAAAYDRQYESALRSLDAIKPGVHSIFQKLGSTDPALTEALAASGVTDSNVMQHLASVEQRVNEIMQMYEMSLQGVPLSLPIEDAEVAYAQGLPYPPPPSTYGGGSASPGGASDSGEGGGAGAGGRSRRVSLEVEISRIGGIGATDGVGASGGARARRAVVTQPVPPSLHDLEDSDEEDARSSAAGGSLAGYGASGGGMGARRASFGRRTSLSRGAQAAGGEPLDPAAEALGLGPGGEAFLSSEPLDPDTLRAHTVALVERKQARALAKDRAAEAARQAFLEGLPPSTAAALYGASVLSGPGGGLAVGSGGSVSGGAAGSFRHIHSSSSRRGSGADAAAGVAAGTSRSGESADASRLAVGALAGGGGGGSEAAGPDGALAASGFVPRPPSQPQGRGSFRTQHMHRAAPGSAASGGGTPKGAGR